ncbi:MAG TPA: carboxypeptidase-like regulatory domain-containing protein, partial [Gemmatimonas sp.]|nr:carboxypeptidase-like regulatory domain-containing protein [Gemmatimonas sp.]
MSRIARLLYVVLTVLLVAAPPRALLAQTDVIRGRVTNAEGQPLANVLVSATSVPGNVTQTRRTNADGRFQFAVAGGTGDYIMGYS